jgi:short-subunit dehydrogenase
MQRRFTSRDIGDQVVVITGASSGIGLATARLAAERGARVVMAARSADALDAAAERIRRAGGSAVWVEADVADAEQVDRIAERAIAAFGRIDTWVNAAAVPLYGQLDAVPLADMRRQFDVNYFGTVHGSLVALRHMERAGGTIINIGSVLSETAVPLQGAYTATKFAVKAFTDTLRQELLARGAPVHVTLVKPPSVDTPFFDHARSHMELVPRAMPPVYAPELVAETILACAVKPVRDVYVGGAAKVMSSMARLAPRLTDRVLAMGAFAPQQRDEPTSAGRPDNLYAPSADAGRVHGEWPGRVRRHSAWTRAELDPLPTIAVIGGIAAATALLVAVAGELRRPAPERFRAIRRGWAGTRRRLGAPSRTGDDPHDHDDAFGHDDAELPAFTL